MRHPSTLNDKGLSLVLVKKWYPRLGGWPRVGGLAIHHRADHSLPDPFAIIHFSSFRAPANLMAGPSRLPFLMRISSKKMAPVTGGRMLQVKMDGNRGTLEICYIINMYVNIFLKNNLAFYLIQTNYLTLSSGN